MNADEYTNLERIEREHWFYAGKREIVRHWLERCCPLSPTARLLDCGAGTGLFAKELEGRCEVSVLDDHEESLSLLRKRFPEERILCLDKGAIPLPNAQLDFLTALDVLEHIEDDSAAVAEFARVVKPGGWVIITVPASMALWSDWDVALHHYRRYTERSLRAVFSTPAWTIHHLNHTNFFAFPAVWLLRRCRAWLPGLQRGTRSEDRLPSPVLNRLLKLVYVVPAKWRSPRLPWGVSLLLVARRNPSSD